jgi:ectoine hydroxylase-related dioxygenase (phytanoyl-CoA dioxygenase family)
LGFLRDVFQEDPVAFQTLYFEYGSTQGAHNDTAFVYVDPPYKFLASWIALEDIDSETGELFYYPGSHKIGDQVFANGGKMFDPKDEHAPTYSRTLDEMMAAHGLSRSTFVPRARDVLFWSADLVHGGTEITKRRTRRSLVTHYCPRSAVVPYARSLGRTPVQTPEGGWIVSAT